MIETLIFLGPSLRPEHARASLPDADFLPPARQGDIYRAVRSLRPRRIGLIDGVFLNVPAVWHREILWALDQGAEIFGAASMGALRAAELSSYGMVGVGKIFAAYRDGHYAPCTDPFEDDDEVAVIHAPSDAGGEALCDAMVDLRETLAAAEDAGLVDRLTRDDLTRSMKELHFPQRSFAALADAARVRLGSEGENFAAWLQEHRISQKARDAREMLQVIACAGSDRPAQSFRFEPALVWERFVSAEEVAVSEEEHGVLAELDLDPAAWHRTARRALGRLAQKEDTAQAGLSAALDRFRRSRGLMTRAALDAWVASNALSAAEFERLLAAEAALDDALGSMSADRLRRAMIDQLRVDGDFVALLTHARKRRTVGAERCEL